MMKLTRVEMLGCLHFNDLDKTKNFYMIELWLYHYSHEEPCYKTNKTITMCFAGFGCHSSYFLWVHIQSKRYTFVWLYVKNLLFLFRAFYYGSFSVMKAANYHHDNINNTIRSPATDFHQDIITFWHIYNSFLWMC